MAFIDTLIANKRKKKEEQNPAPVSNDKRNLASKIFDTLNPVDSGRSFTTATPSEEGAKQGVFEQTKEIGKSLYSGTEKVGDAIDALTGAAERRQKELDRKLQNKEITREEYQSELQKILKDTEWAGTEDKGTLDRLKKSGGVAAETVSEWIPVSRGAKIAKEAKKAGTVTKGIRAKVAADAALQGAAVGGVGGAAGAATEDGSTIEDIAKGGVTGAAGGAVLGAAGSQIGLRKALMPDERGSLSVYKGKIGKDLQERVDAGKLDGNIVTKNANDLQLGSDTLGDVVPATVEDYKVKLQRGEEIDPIIIKRGSDGLDYVADGKHRLQAAQELGINDIPTIRQTDNIALPDKVAPPTEETLNAVIPNRVMAADAAKPATAVAKLTPAKDFSAQAFKDIQDSGGTTIGLDGKRPTSGYSFSPYKDRETIIPKDKFTQKDIDDFKAKNTDLLSDPGNKFGAWTNENGEVVLDVSRVADDLNTAHREAFDNQQDAIWDLGKGEEIKTVEPVEPVKLKVLEDLEDEARVRSPGGEAVKPLQNEKTHAEQGAQYIGQDLVRLEKETGLDVVPVKQDVAKKVSQSLQGHIDQPTGGQSIRKSFANQSQDSLSVAAKTVGKEGKDFVYGMLQGEKFKRDTLSHLREPLQEIRKVSDDLIGKKRFGKASRTAKIDLGRRLGAALDDRANPTKYLKNEKEMKLYDQYVQVFDYIKAIREKTGLEVQENYRPWVKMRTASEQPVWLADSLTNSRADTISRFSKERIRDEASDDVDDNLIDMIYGYVNSQLNEFAYDAPVKSFKKALSEAPSTSRLNSPQFREGMDYLATLTKQAISPKPKTKVEKLITEAGSRVYGAVLPFNPRLTFQNKTQKWAANSRVSKGAVQLSKKMKGEEFADLEKGLVYGDSTIFGQLQDMSEVPDIKGKGFKDKARKFDYYQNSEHQNVVTSFRKGAAQAAIESEPYKAAVKSGAKKIDALKTALADPEVQKLAVARGNMVVNDTQFGASHIARPAVLRSEGSIFGIPARSLTMFTRFPIGMSNHVLEIINGKGARALDVLKNGDPRGSSIAEMRNSYGVLLDALKDSKKSIDNGVDIGIPKATLNNQISTIQKNLNVIDKELKKYSQVRGGKTAANLAKMWTAAAAIQIIFDGGIQSFADDPVGSSTGALGRTNPTATGMIVGDQSKLGSITSAASPINKYGKLNTRALTNYIPGVGLAVNRGRDIKKIYESLAGPGE